VRSIADELKEGALGLAGEVLKGVWSWRLEVGLIKTKL
tara:strand:- start:4367 stop:4480 length:114 start_codon:yes stop_codon:yes gene_type:complete